jgi:MFS family permease
MNAHLTKPVPAPARLHSGWIVALVTFVVLLTTAGIRATPGILIVPLEGELGWSRTVISSAIAINIALFGLIGPFAASVMDRWGLRRVVLAALALVAAAVALTTRMHDQWQLMLLWGVLVGSGTGVTSLVLAAIVATRWFDQRRGLVIGRALGGQRHRPVDFPAAAGAPRGAVRVAYRLPARRLRRTGRLRAGPAVHARSAAGRRSAAIRRARRRGGADPGPGAARSATRSRAFWVLAGTFFICGASTNGLVGTHLIAACHDYGIPQVQSAQLLAVMGIFDILGTTASGWLTDRYPSRYLLFAY